MFKKQLSVFLSLSLALIILLGSCKSKFERLKASHDNARKYQEAIKLYNKRDYSKALELFDDLAQVYRGREGAEDLFYYYAYTNYKVSDFTSARYHFKEFAETFPSSPRAEECRFMAAYCFYLDSPISSLDQENTSKAIDALQLFINLYPKSERVAEAGKLIQNLRDKLEQKAYDNSKLYLTIGEFQSAVIAFGNTLRDYPDTKYAEEMEYLTIRAQYMYAKNSFEYKQEERYNQALGMYNEFVEKHPNSKYAKEVNILRDDCNAGIRNTRAVLADVANNEKLRKKLAAKDTVKAAPVAEKPVTDQKIPQ